MMSTSTLIQAEDRIPTMTYAELLDSLGTFTAMGVISPNNPAGMLVVARLVDRRRIKTSGVSTTRLRAVLETYRKGGEWKPQPAVITALEQAIGVAKKACC
jgi:hypothetical protein